MKELDMTIPGMTTPKPLPNMPPPTTQNASNANFGTQKVNDMDTTNDLKRRDILLDAEEKGLIQDGDDQREDI